MTPQELFDARDRGEKIEVDFGNGIWVIWMGSDWNRNWRFRIVPKPKKTVLKYQALVNDKTGNNNLIPNGLFSGEEEARQYWGSQFIRLLTDRPIECEVQDE